MGGSPGRARVSVPVLPVSPDRAGSAARAGAFTGFFFSLNFLFPLPGLCLGDAVTGPAEPRSAPGDIGWGGSWPPIHELLGSIRWRSRSIPGPQHGEGAAAGKRRRGREPGVCAPVRRRPNPPCRPGGEAAAPALPSPPGKAPRERLRAGRARRVRGRGGRRALTGRGR